MDSEKENPPPQGLCIGFSPSLATQSLHSHNRVLDSSQVTQLKVVMQDVVSALTVFSQSCRSAG